MGLPTVLLSNDDPSTHGTVGLLGSGGALNQIGYKHLRIQQDFTEEHPNLFDTKLLPFVRAASAVERLKGQVFGFIGGRSLGIDTGSFDPMQWKKMFAIDSDHIDHEEIIRRAEQIEPERIETTFKWLVESVGEVKYDEKLTEERLKYQVACYLATKDIIADRKLDFGAIKCMPDLTNFRAPQCISTALLMEGTMLTEILNRSRSPVKQMLTEHFPWNPEAGFRRNAYYVCGCQSYWLQRKTDLSSELWFYVYLLCRTSLRRL